MSNKRKRPEILAPHLGLRLQVIDDEIVLAPIAETADEQRERLLKIVVIGVDFVDDVERLRERDEYDY